MSHQDSEATKVRGWRHKLQKAFLWKTIPTEEDMPALDQLFTTVEEYEDMTVESLTHSKISKVMRRIAVLTDEKVPLDEDYNFRHRAKALVDRWHQILNENKMFSTAQLLSALPASSENGGGNEDNMDENGDWVMV